MPSVGARPAFEFCNRSSSNGVPATTFKGKRVPKRKRPTSKDVEDRQNASFHMHWRASRDQRLQLVTLVVSATDRLKALRERVLAKMTCGETLPDA